MKSLKLISLLILFYFCLHTQAQNEIEPVEGYINYYNRQLSVKAGLVIPAYYTFNIWAPYNEWGDEKVYHIKPDFKLSYMAALQYKNQRNLILEAQFQVFNFGFTGPPEYWNNGLRYPYNQSYAYTETVSYKQYRISAGMGYQKYLGKKTSLDIIAGIALLLGDHGDQTMYTTKTNWVTQPPYYSLPYTYNNYRGRVDNMSNVGLYADVCFTYKIIKNIAITTSINYSNFLYQGGEQVGTYDYFAQNLLSINIGAKYCLLNKPSKKNKKPNPLLDFLSGFGY